MRRIFSVLAVVMVVAVMMGVAAPAFAVGQARCGIGTGESTFAVGGGPLLGQSTAATAQLDQEFGTSLGAGVSQIATVCDQG